jgi:hypothetical protein
METIDHLIAFWTDKMNATQNKELALLCFGVATGLKWAKEDYGAGTKQAALTSAEGNKA